MMRCVISLFILVMKLVLGSAEINTHDITGPSMKAFMDDVIPVTESNSHMEQLVLPIGFN